MKRFLTALTILSLMFITTTVQAAQAFTDISPNHWAYWYVKTLSEEGVVVGYPDGTFRPDNNITRAEFATMAIKALHQDKAVVKSPYSFYDVPKDHWACDMIQKAAYFDLVKGTAEGNFLPEETVSRAQVISIVVNALSLPDITPDEARKILQESYSDYDSVPDWIIVQAGKAESLGILVKSSKNQKCVDANAPATRAEVAAFLQNMVAQVKLHPNCKLAPKTGEGIVLDPTCQNGNIVTIPAGTILTIKMNEFLSTQKAKPCQLFLSKTPDNYITKDKLLLLEKGDKILGQILEVKKAQWFIRNGKLVLETKNIKTLNCQTAEFEAIATLEPQFKTFWEKFYRAIIKHAKIEIYDGQNICVTLLKPIKVDVTTGTIVE